MANLRPNLDAAMIAVLNVQSLTNLATGGVFNTLAPLLAGGRPTPPPYVIFQAFSKIDDNFSFTGRGADAVYMVKAITKTPWPKDAATIDTQVDALLENVTLSITGYSQLVCRRQSDVYLTENVGGEVYTHQGGLYDITADES